MKNLKIKIKLIMAFSLVAFFSLIVGLVGIYGMLEINSGYSASYSRTETALFALGDLRESLQLERITLSALLIDIDNPVKVSEHTNSLRNYEYEMEKALSAYEAGIKNKTSESDYRKLKEAYTLTHKEIKERYVAAINRGDSQEAKAVLYEGREVISLVSDYLKAIEAEEKNAVEIELRETGAIVNIFAVIQIIVISISLIIALFLGLYLSSIISKPLGFMANALMQIGSRGNLELEEKTAESASKEVYRRDEIGVCARAAVGMIEHFKDVESVLVSIAQGDMTVEMKQLSEADNIGISTAAVIDSLNRVFNEINLSTAQVAVGAKQIANGAQSLAKGSTEQAMAVEQLSDSIAEIAIKNKKNTDMSEKASELAAMIKASAERGNHQMEEMMAAVIDINEASQSINKVIRVIDDIAFQTNILALNAAVEAARAGQHGKGFAVVADEVRSLAAKSAEAAKDTEILIANSMEKALSGVRIAQDTAASLADIVTGINESKSLSAEIAKSSEEQSLSIEQINKGIAQVVEVIQQNNAAAEESAAASEELNAQSIALEDMLAWFKLRRRISDKGQMRLR